MNREILFRGKKPVEYYNMIDNSGGKWVEGYLIALHDSQSPAIQSEIKIVPDYVGARIDSKIFCVIPETVSQFTGLYDKNGVRIFENDIVIIGGANRPTVVEFSSGSWQCVKKYTNKGREKEYSYLHRLEYDNPNKYEVIGNRFDNPELLKGK